ncbi:TMEM14 family protein [Leptolyngbya ohadii]|uniref:TMEM14 family protein n=1 Tax=Leptolyngbya ohadii TaxID=1962290 RepID=UPI000B59F590|nr:TMEM14 family protein [Leptolyngbya ohadii]
MSLDIVATYVYGVLALVGGVLGYTKAGSTTSLISGVISSILLIVSGVAQQQGLNWGLPLATIVAIALVIVFAVRLSKTRKFMPAGLMVLAGVLTLLSLVFG